MNLIIVESPAKSKTIEKFLGPKFKVLSSYGHVRDLPKSKLGIDVEKNFEPQYIVPRKSSKNLNILKKEAEKADLIILATDEDREGEAISWHLLKALDLEGKKEYQRISFHEITKPAILEALKNPRKIDINLVDSQQARRVLDRLVGYKLSPFLWKKVARGLSAGRVQSSALKLVVEREREIEKFKKDEYWSIESLLKKKTGDKEFSATLVKENDKVISKLDIKTDKEAEKLTENLEKAEYKIIDLEKKEVRRNPLPPFTTSTLQQGAWKKYKFPAKFTMRIAQSLYEQGLITYHRTDSLNLSETALSAAKEYIINNVGKEYWAGDYRRYKTKSKNAQQAHEAIRPSYPDRTPEVLKKEKLDNNQLKLYEFIWRRFIASQMSQPIFDSTKIEIEAKTETKNYTLQTNGSVLKFNGFLKIYPIKYEESELPPLENNEILDLVKVSPLQHFTQPPARYNEATLIKALEENGIGRPSTYAPILSNIQDRNYIEKNEEKRFKPTEIGITISDLLAEHFPNIVDIEFTANMEKDLDDISEGEKKWEKVVGDFYRPFAKNLEEKYKNISKKDIAEELTEKPCPLCSAKLLIKLGRYGKFYACSQFPKCKHTESLEKNDLNIHCPKCKKGKILEKRTKKRKIFYACSEWPKCDFALWDKPNGEMCPKCKSLLITTKRNQIKCSNKECEKVEK